MPIPAYIAGTRLSQRAVERARAKVPYQRNLALVPFPRSTRLRDGSVGFYGRLPRTDDCQAAALATVLQVPIEEIPDPNVDERLLAGEDPAEIHRSAYAELEAWLERRRLRAVLHRKVPAARSRWLGVVPLGGWFENHCLVMVRGEVLHDPVLDFPPGVVRQFRASEVRWGYSFQRRWRRS